MTPHRMKLGLLSFDCTNEPRSPFVCISVKDRTDDEIAVFRVTHREWQSLSDIADAVRLLTHGGES